MYLLASEASAKLSIGTAALIAVLGYCVVFVGLVLLMAVITIVGKILVGSDKKKSESKKAVEAIIPAEPAATAEEKPVATGSAGELKLHDVDPKTAAILMAIVADKIGKPINELRFKSIREVK